MNVSPPPASIRGVNVRPYPLLIVPGIAAAVAFAVLFVPPKPPAPEISAAAALPMPATGEVDHRFLLTSAWDTARIPRAPRFDPPLGTAHGGLVHNARKFREKDEKHGGLHTGDDLDGIGGMNTDLGDPVFCTADGRVAYAGEPSPDWGNLVVVAHRAADGRTLHSMYAHMTRIEVSPGQLVPRGGRIGTVGTANGHHPAHLHFGMRTGDGVDIGAENAADPRDRLNPMGTVNALRNAAADDLSGSPLGKLLEKR